MTSEESQETLTVFPRVSVVILNHNGLAYMGEEKLKECLDSVIECDYPHLETIFVDNGSSDCSAVFVERNYGSKVAVIKNDRNLGIAEGFNSGIRASRGECLALICNDMVVDRSWLRPIVKLMQLDPRVGVSGCKMLAFGTKSIDFIGGDLYLCGRVRVIGLGEIDTGQYDRNVCDFDYVGGAMIVKRSVIDQVGPYDSDFAIYQEDIDLCLRVREAGYRVVYVFDSVLWHRRQATIGKMNQFFTDYSANRNRICSNLIHFGVGRLFSSFLIDFIWFTMEPRASGKTLLLRAYAWNIKHIAATLSKRRRRGRSPTYGCKVCLHPFILSAPSAFRRWVRKTIFSRRGAPVVMSRFP